MRELVRGRVRWLAAVGLLAVAVGVGTVVGLAQTGGADSEARLRVEGPAEAVPCGERFPVTVYLDELTRRPSPSAEGVEFGLGAVGVRLGYDPQVLRVEEGAGAVAANPALEQVDADADGNAARFQGIGPFIDNHKGEVFFAEFWVGVDPDTKQRYAGPSPAWAGGPLSLFTVTFLANGAGTSALTLSDVEMTDPGEAWYRPVALEQGSVTVSGEKGGCPDLPLPPPQPTPRPAPTVAPTWTPVPTSTPVPPPQAVEPVPAAEGGRPDCPDGWYVYADPDGHFSICYPPDWSARAAPPQIRDSGWSVHIQSPITEATKTGPSIGSVSITVGWTAGSPSVLGCAGAPTEGGRQETLQVAGHQAVACHFEMPHDVPAPELAPSTKTDRVEMDIPLDGGGYLWLIQMRSVEVLDLSRITVEEPLATLRPESSP
jgi:hypothetical protein